MANLKQLRLRIDNVKGTKRITSAMKMMAAVKLRRAQLNAEKTRPYSNYMNKLIKSLSREYQTDDNLASGGPPLLVGRRNDANPIYIIVSSDKGLCGGFNSGLIKFVHQQEAKLKVENKEMNLIMIGRKIVGAVGFTDNTFEVHDEITKFIGDFDFANQLSKRLIEYFENDEFSECYLVYNKFVSILVQELTAQKLIPFTNDGETQTDDSAASFEYEPDKESVLKELLPKNIAVQIYSSMLESFASEQAARMTAMDNATRNADDIIAKLTLNYNRQRQAAITGELIEIISGAEAL